jgi:hypothetical protein
MTLEDAPVELRELDKAPGFVEMLMQAVPQQCEAEQHLAIPWRPSRVPYNTYVCIWQTSLLHMKTCNKGTAYCISSLEHVEKAGQMKLAGPCGIMGFPSLELSLTILNPCPHNTIRFALTKRSEIIAKANSEAQTPEKHPRGVSLLLLNTMTNIRTLRGRYCLLGHGRATSTSSRDIEKAGQPRNLPSNAPLPFNKRALLKRVGAPLHHTHRMQSLITR